MKFMVLAMLLASSMAAPQLPVNSQGAIQAILLPSSSQVSSSVQSQQAIPPGAQIIYLTAQPQQAFVQGQSASTQGQVAVLQGAPQSQFSYVQGPPQGQIIYLQTAPQQFSTVQSSGPQISSFQSSVSQQPSFTPPQQSTFTSVSNTQSFSTPPQQTSFSSFQGAQGPPAQTPPASSFSAPKPQPYRPPVSPARPQVSPPRAQPPKPYKPTQSYTGSPSPGTPGTPGEGGVYGYVTIKQSQDDDFDGNFRYNYETDHGIVVDVVGSVKNQGAEDQIQVIQGSYSYKNPDGTVITTTYIADENGFVAQGDHLPTPGPLPEAIAKALAYIASQPSTEERK